MRSYTSTSALRLPRTLLTAVALAWVMGVLTPCVMAGTTVDLEPPCKSCVVDGKTTLVMADCQVAKPAPPHFTLHTDDAAPSALILRIAAGEQDTTVRRAGISDQTLFSLPTPRPLYLRFEVFLI